MLGDIIQGVYLQYELILTKPNKEVISILDAYGIEFSPRFNGIDVLNFRINYSLNGWLQEKNIDFNNVKGNYLILLNIKKNDEIIKSQYFTIHLVEDTGVEEDIKQVSCYSYQYLWGKKKIRSYKSVRRIYTGQTYSFENNTVGGVLDYILQYKIRGWTVSSISPSLQDIYRVFDISEMSLIELVSEIEKQYGCILIFNTISQSIDIKAVIEIGENKGLYISEQNLMKKINRSVKVDEIVTKLYVYNNDGDSINAKNVTGQSYFFNVDYYRTLDYMSQDLLDALDDYDIVLFNNQSVFEGYLTTLSGYQTTLLQKQNELAGLESQKLQIEDLMDSEKKAYFSNTSIYDDLYDDLQTKESQISSKKSQISTTQSLINGVVANIATLNNIVSLESNFIESQLIDLDRLTFEDTITLNIEDATQLYGEGMYHSNMKAIPRIEFSIDIVDMLSICEFQREWNKILSLGDFITINYDRLNINSLDFRLVEFTHNPDSNSLSLKFNNKNELDTEFLYLSDILKKPIQAAKTVEIERPIYLDYEYDKDRIIYDTDTIYTANNPINIGNGNVITRRGFLGEDIGGNGRIQILDDKIVFSPDGMQSFFTLLSGNGLYLESANGKTRTILTGEYGFQIDQKIGSQWDNVFYIDNDDGSLHIDGAFVELLTENHMNRYIMNPNDAFRIQKNTGTIGTPIWTDTFFVTSTGELVARQMRTDSDVNNFILLREQWLSFYRDNLEKLNIGFEDNTNHYPHIKLGAGDIVGSNKNTFNIVKTEDNIMLTYFTSNSNSHGISIYNSGVFGGYSNGYFLIGTDGSLRLNVSDDIEINGEVGVTDTFDTGDGRVATVTKGIITDIS